MSPVRTCPGRNPSEPSDAPTVFVIDADASVRESLDVLIRSLGCQPIMATSAEEFLAHPRLITPGCLLTELRLPGLTGLELQRLIVERTELPVIFMSKHIDVLSAVKAMKAGAIEVLTKPVAADRLLSVIRSGIEQSRAAVSHLVRLRTFQERYASLSAREREVWGLVVSGRLNKQIAGKLGITEITVKVHRGNMMRKMRAGSFLELVTMAESLVVEGEQMAASMHLAPESPTDTHPLVPSRLPLASGAMAA